MKHRLSNSRLTGAVVGGLVAGIGITVVMLSSERRLGKPSELILLGRATARRQGFQTPSGAVLPSAAEQVAAQAGHLVLSAAAGAVYAATVSPEARVIPSGIGFGLAVYAALHWLAGPLLGVKNPEWRSDAKTVVVHALNHAGFGLLTALGARAATPSRMLSTGGPSRASVVRP